ncbi:MAG: FtsX-like permease family protein, partial [Pedobacter sp.]
AAFGARGVAGPSLADFNSVAQTIAVLDSNVENSDFAIDSGNWNGTAASFGTGGKPALFVGHLSTMNVLFADGHVKTMKPLQTISTIMGGSGTININWEGKRPDEQPVVPSIDVSENFIDVFNMKIIAGRGFSNSILGDSNNYIVNEKAVAMMRMKPETAVGQQITFQDTKGMIIGVVKDFNFKPIQTAIEPLVLRLNRWGGLVVVRTKPGQTDATITALGKISKDLNPAYPFSYGFLDQELNKLYKGEQRLGTLFNIFAILAIFISCLGLYGLSAFMAEQRTREIGVRKVLGSSVFGIVYLLSTGFTRLILLSIAIAIPIAWYWINKWLESFAYHV